MRVTISLASTNEPVFSLVDGSWLNSWPVRGELLALEKDGLDGWYESVDPRVDDMPELPGQHGSFWPEEVLLASRVLTIRGFHYGMVGRSSTLAVARFRDLVASLVGVALRVAVEDAAGMREVTGYISSQVPMTLLTERGTKFSLIIMCPDPLKYGQAVAYPAGGGVVSLENVGTGDVAFTVSTQSRIKSLQVQYSGSRFVWEGDSKDGLFVDLADGRPVDAAGAEVGFLVDADPIRVPPGRHSVSVVADVPVTVTLRPGWK